MKRAYLPGLRLPVGARMYDLRHEPGLGLYVDLRWAWWRPQWTRTAKWKGVGT